MPALMALATGLLMLPAAAPPPAPTATAADVAAADVDDEASPAAQLAQAERIACLLGDPHYGTPNAGVALGLPPLPEDAGGGAATPVVAAGGAAAAPAPAAPVASAEEDDVDVAVAKAAAATAASAAAQPPSPALPFPADALRDFGARHAYLSTLGLRAGSGILRAVLQKRIIDKAFAAAVAALVEAATVLPPLHAYLFRLPPLDPR